MEGEEPFERKELDGIFFLNYPSRRKNPSLGRFPWHWLARHGARAHGRPSRIITYCPHPSTTTTTTTTMTVTPC
jgi:hypothetical protein